MMRTSDRLLDVRREGAMIDTRVQLVPSVLSILAVNGLRPPYPLEPGMQLFVNSTNTIIIKGHKTPNSHHRNWSKIRMLLQLFS